MAPVRPSRQPHAPQKPTMTVAVPAQAMWTYIANVQGRIFYEQWCQAAQDSNSVACKNAYSGLSAPHTTHRLWAGALNAISAVYYANSGWTNHSPFALPEAWRNDSITAMLEQMVRSSYIRKPTDIGQAPNTRGQIRTPNGVPHEHIVFLAPRENVNTRDGPGESRDPSPAGVPPPKKRRKDVAKENSSTNIEEPMAGTPPSGTTPLLAPTQGLVLTNFSAPGNDNCPSSYCQAILEDQVQEPPLDDDTSLNHPIYVKEELQMHQQQEAEPGAF
jgi:hypothetical protein